MAEAIWTKWAWHLGAPDFEEFETYAEAIEAACSASDHGEESFDCIEGPAGVVDSVKVKADMDAVWQAEREERDAYSEAHPPTHAIRVRQPIGDREAWGDVFESAEDAEVAAAKLRGRFGDRVRIVTRKANGSWNF